MLTDRSQLRALGQLVDAKTLAERLSLSRRTVYDMARDGRIPGLKVGGQWRFDVERVGEVFWAGASLGLSQALAKIGGEHLYNWLVEYSRRKGHPDLYFSGFSELSRLSGVSVSEVKRILKEFSDTSVRRDGWFHSCIAMVDVTGTSLFVRVTAMDAGKVWHGSP